MAETHAETAAQAQGQTKAKVHRVTLIPGDGIGPEVTRATVRVLEATGVSFEWVEVVAGETAIPKFGSPLPDVVLEKIRETRVALKGPVGTPIGHGFRSVNMTLRQELDLYACLRRTKTIVGIASRYQGVDIIVVRENTEGIYSGIEHEVVPGVVETIRIITEKASRRIAKFAFELAEREGRKRVTAVHKANIMKLGDGLFLRCVREIAAAHPKIQYDEMIIDNTCMQLVLRPERFDILVMENFHGDIISDLTAGLVGGTGVCAGSNLGEGIAVFEAIHGTAPDIAGKGIANPAALILCGAEMLHWLGEKAAAERVEGAVYRVIADRVKTTRDLGGTATTDEFAGAVIEALAA